ELRLPAAERRDVRSGARGRLRFLHRHCGSALRPAGLADLGRVRAREVCGPVGLPVAVVVRERLIPARVVVIHLVPGVANLHWLSAVDVFTVELAMLAVESADDRRLEPAAFAAHPIDRPLLFRRVEGAERKPRPALGRKPELVHSRHAAEIERHAKRRGKLLPVIAADAARLQTALLRGPAARKIVEVMHAAGPGKRVAGRSGGGGERRRCEGRQARGEKPSGRAPHSTPYQICFIRLALNGWSSRGSTSATKRIVFGSPAWWSNAAWSFQPE